MFLSVEGADRTGKDSICHGLDKEVRWANCTMMRGPAGCLTYDKIYNRETPERYNEALSVAQAIKSTKHLIVYLYADVETIEERLQEEINNGGSGEFAPEGWSIKDVLDLYEKNIDFLYNKSEVLKINTSHYSVSDCIQIIAKRLEQIRNMDFQLLYDESAKNIKSPNRGSFTYTQFEPLTYIFAKEELKDRVFDISVDPPYYKMLEATLEHKLYEYQLGWINDRQLVYTSSDCISYVQIKITDEKIYWFVSQRSCDIQKHELNDVLFFKYLSDKLFKDKDFSIHYTCVFPHKYNNENE